MTSSTRAHTAVCRTPSLITALAAGVQGRAVSSDKMETNCACADATVVSCAACVGGIICTVGHKRARATQICSSTRHFVVAILACAYTTVSSCAACIRGTVCCSYDRRACNTHISRPARRVLPKAVCASTDSTVDRTAASVCRAIGCVRHCSADTARL